MDICQTLNWQQIVQVKLVVKQNWKLVYKMQMVWIQLDKMWWKIALGVMHK